MRQASLAMRLRSNCDCFSHQSNTLVFLRRRAWLLKHLIISVAFCSSRTNCDELVLHVTEVASISSIMSALHAGVVPFSDPKIFEILRQSCQLTHAAFASAFTMLPNGLVQLFSENILEVPDTLNQHKLQTKRWRSG